MNRHDEEEAWRQIVANYGERAHLDDDTTEPQSDADQAGVTGTDESTEERDGQPGADDPAEPGAEEPTTGGTVPHPDDEDTVLPADFVPPEPPPLPRPRGPRGLAWVGLLGSPLVLVLAVVLGVDLPPLVGLALAGAFVGGFCYLVATMPPGPTGPGDDGARL